MCVRAGATHARAPKDSTNKPTLLMHHHHNRCATRNVRQVEREINTVFMTSLLHFPPLSGIQTTHKRNIVFVCVCVSVCSRARAFTHMPLISVDFGIYGSQARRLGCGRCCAGVTMTTRRPRTGPTPPPPPRRRLGTHNSVSAILAFNALAWRKSEGD